MKIAKKQKLNQAVRYLLVPGDRKTEEALRQDAAAETSREPAPVKRNAQPYLTVPESVERFVDGWEVGEAFFKAFRHKISTFGLSLRVYGLEEGQRHAVHWKTMWKNGVSCLYRDPDA